MKWKFWKKGKAIIDDDEDNSYDAFNRDQAAYFKKKGYTDGSSAFQRESNKRVQVPASQERSLVPYSSKPELKPSSNTLGRTASDPKRQIPQDDYNHQIKEALGKEVLSALEKNDVEQIIRIFDPDRRYLNVNKVKIAGLSVLSTCVKRRNSDALYTCLSFLPNVDVCVIDHTMHGDTPLHWAAYRHDLLSALLLINHDRTVLIQRNLKQKLPLDYGLESTTASPALIKVLSEETLFKSDLSPQEDAILRRYPELARKFVVDFEDDLDIIPLDEAPSPLLLKEALPEYSSSLTEKKPIVKKKRQKQEEDLLGLDFFTSTQPSKTSNPPVLPPLPFPLIQSSPSQMGQPYQPPLLYLPYGPYWPYANYAGFAPPVFSEQQTEETYRVIGSTKNHGWANK